MTAWTFNCPVFASKFDATLNIGSSGLSIPTRLSLLMPRLENINEQLPSGFIKKMSGNSYLILFYLELFCCCCCCSLNLRRQSIFKNIDASFLFQEWFSSEKSLNHQWLLGIYHIQEKEAMLSVIQWELQVCGVGSLKLII